MTIKQLREKRATKVKAMRAMVEAHESSDGTTAFDQEAFDALEAAVGTIAVQIESQERLEALEVQLAASIPAVAEGQIASGVEVTLDAGDQPFASLGEFAILAHLGGMGDPRMVQHEITAEQRMDTGIKGGYAIPQQHSAQVMKIDPAANPFTAMALHLPAGTPPDAALTFPALDQTGDAPAHQFGGVAVTWEGEGVTASLTDGSIREVTLEPFGVSGYVPVTDKLLRNWQAAGAWINGLLGPALSAGLELAFQAGNGIKKPLGFRASDAALTVNRNTAGTVKLADLAKMKARRLGMGGPAAWLINPSLEEDLIQLINANNNLVWRDTPDSIVAGSPATLLGVPVFMDEFAAAEGVLGDVALVQPNPAYMIKPGSGPFVETGKSGTDFEAGKSKIKISHHVGGQPWLTEPYKRRDGTLTSPFVLLDVVAS